MPRIVETPKLLKPYLTLGVEIDYQEGEEQQVGACPFCGREGKFSIACSTGQWRCYVCATGTDKGGGNLMTFLRELWTRSRDRTKVDYEELAQHRKLAPDTLKKWGVVKSVLTNEWLVPGYNLDRKISQLYRYVPDPKDGKYRLLASPEVSHQLFGLNLWIDAKPEVWVCEGPWDAMAAWELIRNVKDSDGQLVMTSNEILSVYGRTNIVAVPGCNVFHESWGRLFAGKKVCLLFDSDHPRENAGKTFRAGYDGMKRVTNILGRTEEKPEEINYIRWGPEGYDPARPSGFDLRDLLTSETKDEGRIKALAEVFSLLEPIPDDWIGGRSLASKAKGAADIEWLPCKTWSELVTVWRKALKWTEGLDRALSVMLASICSVKAVGDQLWIKVIGPAACGKSTLCEAVSVNKKYVIAKSTIRGFHSGFKSDAEGKEDNSLVAQLYNKTLVTKDGDTLLQSPNLGQILSEARDLYDSTSRTHYRNKMGKDYQGVRTTWILCGTSSLRSLDSSELGERFLDCVIMNVIDEDLEDEILWRKVNQADRAMSFESDGDIGSGHDPDMLRAMQLTGGYVSYLRENAQELLAAVELPDDQKRRCMHLAKFVSILRARPSTRQDEGGERELATRLASQLVRLAKCLAVVLNNRVVEEEVMRRVTRVALDTARGLTLDVIDVLYKHGSEGMESAAIPLFTAHPPEKDRVLLRFLRSPQIGAVEVTEKRTKNGIGAKPRWRLTSRMTKLYQEVMKGAE